MVYFCIRGGRMSVSTRQLEGITIIDLGAKATGVALRDAFDEALSQGARKVLLNLAEVRSIDTTGLGELLAMLRRADKVGGKISFTNLPSNMEELLHVARVDPPFDIYETEDEAIKAMQ